MFSFLNVLSILNDLHEDINFTMEINNETLPFLDILICKDKCNITTDIYSKDTDTKQYLNFKSCHPKHTKTSIPYNLARRICTIVSEKHTRDKRLDELKTTLKLRNFPTTVIETGIQKALQTPRSQLLQTQLTNRNDESIIPYVSTHNPNNIQLLTNLKKNFLHS